MKSQHSIALSSHAIPATVFQAATASPKSAVVVAYGTEGAKPPFGKLIEHYCEGLAKAGYLVVFPDYFSSTSTAPGLATVAPDLSKIGTWVEVVSELGEWTSSQVATGPVALLGFSLGANVVLNAALQRDVTAIVDFFGPVTSFGVLPLPSNAELSKGRADGLPPTLIHHGRNDLIVRPNQSATLEGWLDDHGIECVVHDDYDSGHPGQPEMGWSDADRDTSLSNTIAFLSSRLP